MSNQPVTQQLIFGDSIADDLRVIRGVVNSFAAQTATQIDDTVVQVIDLILGSPRLIALIDGILGGKQPHPVAEELNLAAGFDPATLAKLLRYLPIILDLIRTFRGFPKAA